MVDKQPIKTILRSFPFLADRNKACNLKIDNDSLYYISLREDAEEITKIIITHLIKNNIDPHSITITDSTAGVGGNTISFGANFAHVNAVEIDNKRSLYLKNNIDVYELKNINVINKDYITICNTLKQDVVFIDPPWGGKDYKIHKCLKLKLSDIPIETICNNLLDPNITLYVPKLIVLKLPTNYDITHLYKVLTSKTIYLCDLKKKMFILIIVNDSK